MFYQGTIEGASGAANNTTTGVSGALPFVLPKGAKALYLVPSVAGLQFELGAASFLTSAVRGAPIGPSGIICGPFRFGQPGSPTVSIYNAAGGGVTVKVYVGPTS